MITVQKINEHVPKNNTLSNCYHCGGLLPKKSLEKDGYLFCCKACVSVYSILKDAGLEKLYSNQLSANFSKPLEEEFNLEFEFLEHSAIQEKIITFRERNICKAVLYAPEIHCVSCIWLLEHLPKLHSGIIQSHVNFHSKKISILFDISKIQLKELAIFLTQIGYRPYFSFDTIQKDNHPENKKLLMRLGVAGFAFGNIMLLNFPDYLDSLSTLEIQYAKLFHYVSFILSLPVLLFSAHPFLKSAWSGLKARDLNMDIPIGIGILTLFFRSTYDVFLLNEPGYFDSLSGFIFFLLVGRWYQLKTYQFLDFDKSLNSFFPISVIKIEKLNEVVCEVKDIQEKDIVKLRNGELIPFECVLLSNEAKIDYSFVTGESEIFTKKKDDLIYAGGKLYGQKIVVKLKKPFDQKYFIQLWNENTQRKKSYFEKISAILGKLITTIVLTTALLSAIYWRNSELNQILKVVTSVLIVGCSCAFALSAPFLFGNISRILSKLNVYVKNADSIATLAHIQHIVLDKTGTITEKSFKAKWNGNILDENTINLLYALFQNSFHPLSKKITDLLKDSVTDYYECEYFNEQTGKGIEAIVHHKSIKAGSKEWIECYDLSGNTNDTNVFVKINDEVLGYFSIQTEIRDAITNLNKLKKKYKLHILTGDSSKNTELIKKHLEGIDIHTHQTPEDKKTFIEKLQNNGERVLMIGDGLNDMPALKTADFGISISDDHSYFAPSGDAIMKGDSLKYISDILRFSKKAYQLLIISYIFSFLYNVIGLFLAFNAYLSPLIAAIFMPLSSISVVLFAVLSSDYFAKKNFNN